MIILDQPDQILAYHMAAQYHAAKLHLMGLRHSSGRSVIKHIKDTYGLKGTNESVVEQFGKALLEKGIISRL